MGKLVAFATYDRFRSALNNDDINEYSLNFIVNTGLLYTHGILFNSVTFGAEASGGVPVTIAGVTKTLSLSNHTHSTYLEKNSNIDIGSYKIVSDTTDLLYLDNNGINIGNTNTSTYIKGPAYRDSYTILDTGNFSITNTTINGSILSNVALFTYGSNKFQLDYVKRVNTSSTFDNLTSYTCLGTTNVDQKLYGFVTFYTSEGILSSPWAQLRININDKTLEYRTSRSTTWSNVSTPVLPVNALNVAGIVSAPTATTTNKVWKTDANGNPGWRDETYSSFHDLQFLSATGTNLMVYNSQATKTVVAGTNISFTYADDVLTINSLTFTDTWRGIYVDQVSKLGTSIATKALNFKAAGGITLTYTAAGENDNYNTLLISSTTYGVVSKTAPGLCPQLPNENTTAKYLRLDGTWVDPPNSLYYLTLNNTVKGTSGTTNLGTIYAPESAGTGFLKGTAGLNGAITWSWDNSTYSLSNHNHDDRYYRTISHDTEWDTPSNMPTNLALGHHSIHVSGYEHSSVLTGEDLHGSYWQLYFHPSSGYTQDIKYRASNCTDWKTILDSNNSSVSKSGETLTVKINNSTLSITNTWRDVLDNLTSDSTTDSLSAALGKALNNKFSNYFLKSGDTANWVHSKKYIMHHPNLAFNIPENIRGRLAYEASAPTTEPVLINTFDRGSGIYLRAASHESVPGASHIALKADEGIYLDGPSYYNGTEIEVKGHTHNYDDRYLKLSGGTMTGNIKWSNSPGNLLWESGSWYQRISIYDDGNTATPVFSFEESQGTSGNSWTTLFEIYGNGTIKASNFNGNASSATKLASSVTLWGLSFDGSNNVSGSISGVFETLSFSRENWNYFVVPSNNGNFGFNIGQAGTSPSYLRMCITNAGRVGIGTASPGWKLDCLGPGHFTSSGWGDQLYVYRSDGANNALVTFKNTSGVIGYLGIAGSNDPLGIVPIYVTSGGTGYMLYHTGNLPAYPTKASWNYDDCYLKLTGGTLTNSNWGGQLTIKRSSVGGDAVIKYDSNGTTVGAIGIRADTTPVFYAGTNTSGNLIYHAGNLKTMVKSGSTHAGGLVPDTPSTEGTTKYLREDATWQTPPDTKYYLTLNGTVNGTSGSTNLGTIYTPTTSGTGFLKSSVSNNVVTWSYDSTNYLPLTGGVMSGPIMFNLHGNGTYTKAGIWVTPNYGLVVETPRSTNNANSLILPFYINTRGGLSAPLYAGNIYSNGTIVSLSGHKHPYTDLTGSTTTADQVIVSNGTVNGWTLKTLGTSAFTNSDNTITMSRAAGNLTKDTWADVGTFTDTTPEGTWVISFTIDGSLYSGVFSRKKNDTMSEEIDLHAAGTSTKRIYARTTGNKVQIVTADETFDPGAITFNFRKLI